MLWTDHIDARTATKDEIIDFIKQRERLAHQSLKTIQAKSDDETLIVCYLSEWATYAGLLHSLGL